MKKITIFILALFTSLFGFSQTDLISNGNFHTCNESWAITGDFTYACGDDFYTHYNFSYGYGYNLQIDDASGTLGQSLQYPSNVDSAELKFYHKITTEEIDNSTAFDKLTIVLVSDSETYEVDELSNMDNSTSYIEKTYDIPTDLFNNETITLAFIVNNDGLKPTRFRVDDVSLLVSTGNSGNDFNIAVENVEVSDTNPDIGQTINLSCDQVIEGDCGCSGNLDPRPDIAFGWSTSSTYHPSNFNLIDTQNSTIGSTDSGDPEDVDWTVPNSLEGQTIYIYFIPDYNDEHNESTEGEYSTVTINVNGSNQNTDGTITSNLLPSNAVANGAQWKTTSNTEWLNSGETLTMPFGTYSLEFKEISGWIEPSNQTITISDSSPNYSNNFTYSEINSTYGSISGTLVNPQINDNFQIVNGSLNGFVIKLFENGNSTPIQETNANNTFTFNDLEDGFYHIVAQNISNGNVIYETQKSVTITNSNNINISLKSSKGLISQISDFNDQLSNLSCYWSFTDENYFVNTGNTNNSYDVNVSASYIINNAFITDNDNEVLDKLSRFAILSKATLEYYNLGCELTSNLLESFKDGTSASFDLLEGIFCTPDGLTTTIGQYAFNAIKNSTIYLIENLADANQLNITSALNGLFDTIELYLLGYYPSISTYAQIISVNGLDETLVNKFLVNGYINKTSLQFNTSINRIFNNNLNSNISTLGNDTKNALFLIETGTVDVTIATASSYRNSPAWVDFTNLLNDTFGGCDPLSATWNIGSNLVELASISNSLFHLNYGRQELYNNVNINLSNVTFQRNATFNNNCTQDYITELNEQYNNKINEYNSKLTLIVNSIDNFNSQYATDILTIHNELNFIEEILRAMYMKIQINSSLDSDTYSNLYYNSSYEVPMNRFAMTLMLAKLLETSDDVFKNEILNNSTQVLNSNTNGYNNWLNLYNSLSTYCTPVDLIVTKKDVPRRIGTDSNSTLSLDITNVGSLPATNVDIQIITNGSIVFSQNNYNFQSINPTSTISVDVPVNSGSIINISDYEIIVSSSELDTSFVTGGKIATVDSSTLSTQLFDLNNLFKIYPNPTNEILNIQNNNNIRIDKVKIFNILGSLVFKSDKYENKINVNNLLTGIYLIKLYHENETYTYKFIKD